MEALSIAAMACAGVALGTWLLGLATGEHSWVDRLWSILPPLYVAWFAYAAGFPPRLVVLSMLALAWGARLTFNFARKGGYAKGGEDYRWAELRGRMSRPAFALFHATFIAGFQNALLLAITLPAWRASTRADVALGAIDLVATALFALFLVGETIADEQQWRFQRDKRARRARSEPIEHEFLTTGLFRYSRHPNFFCEQAMWWTLCLFAVAATGEWLDPTFLGALVLSALFHGSTSFTEELSLKKYPSYAEYQRKTSRLVPWLPRR